MWMFLMCSQVCGELGNMTIQLYRETLLIGVGKGWIWPGNILPSVHSLHQSVQTLKDVVQDNLSHNVLTFPEGNMVLMCNTWRIPPSLVILPPVPENCQKYETEWMLKLQKLRCKTLKKWTKCENTSNLCLIYSENPKWIHFLFELFIHL